MILLHPRRIAIKPGARRASLGKGECKRRQKQNIELKRNDQRWATDEKKKQTPHQSPFSPFAPALQQLGAGGCVIRAYLCENGEQMGEGARRSGERLNDLSAKNKKAEGKNKKNWV